MQVSVEKVEAGGHEMTIEVESTQAQQIGKAVASQASIPGFRPGRAPLAAVIRSLSSEELASAVGDASETKAIIQQALEESELDTSADTLVDSVTWNPLVLKIAVAGEEAEDDEAANGEAEDGKE